MNDPGHNAASNHKEKAMRTRIQESDTRTEKGYFLGKPRHGRTTTLLDGVTNRVLGVYMGVVTRHQAYQTWMSDQAVFESI